MRNGAPAIDKPAVRLCAALCGIVWLALASVSAAAAETYVRAAIDKTGQLHIVTSSRREIVPQKHADQVGFDKAAISPDGRTVGWLELYPFCCTSYPIPLGLVIYSRGQTRKFAGSGLPIFRWCFEARGKRVAFGQETLHGGMGLHYELRDVSTGRLVAEYTPTPDPDPDAERGVTPADAPKWVAELNAQR